MGLDDKDKKPQKISLRKAYAKIRKWYRAHVDLIEGRSEPYYQSSASLIRALPEGKCLSVVEIRTVLSQVVCGKLEWAFHQDDGDYKMGAYAIAALEAASGSFFLSVAEIEKIRNPVLRLQIIEEIDVSNRPL